jgi:hypothetical protein
MQLTKTIFLDSATFIEIKKVENLLWKTKSAFCGEKEKNAGEKKYHLNLVLQVVCEF